MQSLETARKLCGILSHYTKSVRGNIHFGNYPTIGWYNGIFRHFPFDVKNNEWYLPFGIPYLMKKHVEEGSSINHIAYMIGENLYVHDVMFEEYVFSDMGNACLYNPIVESTIELTRGAWSEKERVCYEDFLWKLSSKTMSTDFQKIVDIDFNVISQVDNEL